MKVGHHGVVDAVRGRLRPSPSGARYTDKPYASAQLLALASVGLLLFGVLMAVSTTIAAAQEANTPGAIWLQSIKEVEFIGVGLLLFVFAARLSPRGLRMLAYPILALSLVAMVAVLLPGIGVQSYGARRWLELGPLQVQPSEFGKVAMLLWGADLLTRKRQFGSLRRARHLFVPLVPGFAVMTLLVMLEPDLGTTCCFMLILLGLLWMIGMPLRYFLVLLAAVAAAVTALAIAAPYRLARLTNFVDPFKNAKTTGYHTVEGLYALASGGVFGVGLGQGTSKYTWVPNANSDFVFAIVGEELGLLGCVAVVALFGLLAYAGLRVARRSVDPFAQLVAGAATVWLCGQAVINIGYVTGLLPVTGIPLPLISAGGTSLLVTFFVLGMVMSFARHEPAAVSAARKAYRLGRRTRLERWARIPIPQVYAAPRPRMTRAERAERAAAAPRQAPAAARPAAARPAAARPAAARATAAPARRPGAPEWRTSGTDGMIKPRRLATGTDDR